MLKLSISDVLFYENELLYENIFSCFIYIIWFSKTK